MILRLLNIQGIAGLAVSIALALLLVMQKGETRHWKKQSASFEQLYAAQRSALDTTVANYRAAAAQARAADLANLQRVQSQQRAISERTDDDFQARIAAARIAAQRLRGAAASAPADRGAGRGAPVPGLPTAPGGTAQAAGEDRLPDPDRLVATEQAIQLDELIKWVRRLHSVEADGRAERSTSERLP
jgi:hypothetical protein